MNLAEYDGKYVRIRDADGNDFLGRASYGSVDFLECEWGMNEDEYRGCCGSSTSSASI